MNNVTATGILLKTGRGDFGYAEILLLIKRPHMAEDAYVRFVLETTLDPSIQVRDIVTVTGYIRGYNSRDRDGKWNIVQYFAATDVRSAQGELSKTFGIKDHFNPKHEFKAFVDGKIGSIIDISADWKSVLVNVNGNKEIPDIVTVGLKNNSRVQNEFNEMEQGDSIALYLNVRTPKKVVKGVEKSFEDLVVEDFAITNREIERSVAPEGNGYYRNMKRNHHGHKESDK